MKTLYTLAFVAALAAGPAHAACTYPKAPEKIPDGSTADLAQMKAAQAEVKRFNDEITAYQSCLKTEFDAALAKPDLTDEQKKEREQIYASKNDAAFEAVSAIVAQWSEQRAAYIKKQDEAKKAGQ